MGVKQKNKPVGFVVCWDANRRTCLMVERGDEFIRYIPLDIATGFEVRQLAAVTFDKLYKSIKDYPADRAAQLYAGYARTVGASAEAIDALSQLVEISQPDRERMSERYGAITPPESGKPVVKTKAKIPKKSGVEKGSASSRFRELIMQGKLSDDQIFAAVQAEFSLPDSKRGYVKWYRNQLIKQGKNPPEAK